VHEKIYDEFVRKSVEAARKIKVGDPFDENTFQVRVIYIFVLKFLMDIKFYNRY
jgi:hypothetical protein